jgi:hypothetical protein
MYDVDCAFPVYELHEWWSDKWDPQSYGQQFDSKRPFFDQLVELHRKVPRMSIMNSNCENTDYCGISFNSRNCYMVFGNVGNEDCMNGHIVWLSKNCFDCLYIYRCEFCFECIDCVQCHSLGYSRDCDNCASSMFLEHCIGCRNCFGCVGLKNKEYCIFNEQHSKEDYTRMLKELNTGNIRTIDLARQRVQELIGHETVKYYHGFNCENVTGDYLYNCRNIVQGYDLKNSEDCKHCATSESFTNCYDCNFSGVPMQFSYQTMTSEGYGLLFCHTCLQPSANLIYCDNCFGCKDCFGCVGLKKKQYCILNKQYSKEEYEALVPEVIERMRKDKEWGEYLPPRISPFAFNETVAKEYFPLSKEEVLRRGWRWKDEKAEEQKYMGPPVVIPEDIAQVPDDITGKILRCEATGKLYKILPQELKFYRTMNVPVPRLCFMERQRQRFAMRNPRHLWKRKCGKCAKEIETTYAPERPETVYCEACYLSTVY